MTSELDNPLPLSEHIQGEQGEPETLTRKPSPLFYGMGTLGFAISVETFNTFAYFYYIDFLGLTITLVALARTIYAIWDAVNDSLFGYLSDNTRTRLGRRRPWLLMSVPLLALCFVFIFVVPVVPGNKNLLFFVFVRYHFVVRNLGHDRRSQLQCSVSGVVPNTAGSRPGWRF